MGIANRPNMSTSCPSEDNSQLEGTRGESPSPFKSAIHKLKLDGIIAEGSFTMKGGWPLGYTYQR